MRRLMLMPLLTLIRKEWRDTRALTIASALIVPLALLAMNIDALSLAPGSIPEIKRLFASSHVGPLADSLDAILALDTASEIKEAMREFAPSQNVPGGRAS